MKHLTSLFGLYLLCLSCIYAQTLHYKIPFPATAAVTRSYAVCSYPSEYQKQMAENVRIGKSLVYDTLYTSEIILPRYDTLTENVMVYPEYSYLEWTGGDSLTSIKEYNIAKEEMVEYFSPIYRLRKERKLLEGEGQRWEKGLKSAFCLSSNPDDCSTVRLSPIAPQYALVKYHEVVRPAHKIIHKGGTEVMEELTDNSPYIRKVTVPAQYKIVRKYAPQSEPYILVSQEIIPAKTQDEEGNVISFVRAGGMSDWREMPCCECMSDIPPIIHIQRALKDKGYYKGELDNILNAETKASLKQFQKDNDLQIGKLDTETLTALNIQ